MSRPAPRIIPVLLNHRDRLVKTINFERPSYIGDPLNTVLMFSELEADELILLDIEASKSRAGPNYKLVETVAEFAQMPLCYGGGVSTIYEARRLFSLGIEKISVNSALQTTPQLVGELAAEFGRQAVVASLDFRRNASDQTSVYFHATKTWANLAPVDFARRLEDIGAGEILLNCVDREGTWLGPDVKVAGQIAESVGIPVVTSGGVGSVEDIAIIAERTLCTGIGVGSVVFYQKKGHGVLVGLPNDSIYRSGVADRL